jgi:hypothetical protein
MPTKPVIVALLRGFIEAVAIAGIGLVVSLVTELDGAAALYAAPALLALRTLEGVADSAAPT